jgi:hypothetical protein
MLRLRISDTIWRGAACIVTLLHSPPSHPVLWLPVCLQLTTVPGIDMCNHSSTAPNATVRMLHSPGACQGLAALEEVAPAAAQAACGSYFQLLAGGQMQQKLSLLHSACAGCEHP